MMMQFVCTARSADDEDYRRGGHAELPPFLRPHLPDARPARHSEPLRKGAGHGAEESHRV